MLEDLNMNVKMMITILASVVILMCVLLCTSPAVVADRAKNNSRDEAELMTPGEEFTGGISEEEDFLDYWKVDLIGGRKDADRLNLSIEISQWSYMGWIHIYMPTDRDKHNLNIFIDTIGEDGHFYVTFTATVSGCHYLKLSGGTFEYSITPAVTKVPTNDKYDGNDDFASAEVLQGSGVIEGQSLTRFEDYVDIYKFYAAETDVVSFNFSGDVVFGTQIDLVDGKDYSILYDDEDRFDTHLVDMEWFQALDFTGKEGVFYLVVNLGWIAEDEGGYSFTYDVPSDFVDPSGDDDIIPDDDDDDDDGGSLGLIILLIVGGIVFLAILIAVVVIVLYRMRKKW